MIVIIIVKEKESVRMGGFVFYRDFYIIYNNVYARVRAHARKRCCANRIGKNTRCCGDLKTRGFRGKNTEKPLKTLILNFFNFF